VRKIVRRINEATPLQKKERYSTGPPISKRAGDTCRGGKKVFLSFYLVTKVIDGQVLQKGGRGREFNSEGGGSKELEKGGRKGATKGRNRIGGRGTSKGRFRETQAEVSLRGQAHLCTRELKKPVPEGEGQGRHAIKEETSMAE